MSYISLIYQKKKCLITDDSLHSIKVLRLIKRKLIANFHIKIFLKKKKQFAFFLYPRTFQPYFKGPKFKVFNKNVIFYLKKRLSIKFLTRFSDNG